MKVIHSGEVFDCATAVKCDVNRFIKLYDENGFEIASFDDISDFSDYTASGGQFTAPGNCTLPIPLFVFSLGGKIYCALNVKSGEMVELTTAGALDHYSDMGKLSADLLNSTITLENLSSAMPDNSVLDMEMWKPSVTAFNYPANLRGSYLKLIIRKSIDTFISAELHDLEYNELYICSKYATTWLPWRRIVTEEA